jgi:dTDP-glucose pyrophosphorylase
MILGGADKLCFVIAPGKSDIMEYYGEGYSSATIAYVVQRNAAGLCDAIFRAHPLIAREESVLVGLPDTVWFPEDALRDLPDDVLSFLLFPVSQPQFFDAVLLQSDAEQYPTPNAQRPNSDRVRAIKVKEPNPGTNWIWGAFKMPGCVFHDLRTLWLSRNRADEYIGTLINAYLASGGEARGFRLGHSYVDVGTLQGYRSAMGLLSATDDSVSALKEPALHARTVTVEDESR